MHKSQIKFLLDVFQSIQKKHIEAISIRIETNSNGFEIAIGDTCCYSFDEKTSEDTATEQIYEIENCVKRLENK